MAESEGTHNDSSLDITVKTCTGKMIALQVKGSDTIFDVKTKIKSKKCLPVEEQALIFGGELLEDDIFTLANFGINSGSTLTLLRRSRGLVPIFIKFKDGLLRTLKVKLSDTINNVKTNITTIEPSKLVLIFNDTVLDDNSTLCDFDIKKGSTLTVMHKKGVYLEIFVKTLAGETKPLTVQSSYTIAKVKSYVGDYEVDDEGKVLIFNETVLEDNSNISDFDIKNGSTLTLLHKSTGRHMQIFVKTLTGETRSLTVQPSYTIARVKSFVDPDGVLIFNETVLEDSCNVSDFDIKNGSTLTLLHKSTGRCMQIFVKTLTGETKPLTVQPSYTIARVKSSVGDPASVLIFNEMVLEDSSNVSDFDIKNGSTLTLLPKSTGRMQIFVLNEFLFTRKSISLEVKHSDTILYVKSKIQDITGIPTSEQILIMDVWRLKDSCTLDDYNICKGDIIQLMIHL